jgi:hypothetical protein
MEGVAMFGWLRRKKPVEPETPAEKRARLADNVRNSGIWLESFREMLRHDAKNADWNAYTQMGIKRAAWSAELAEIDAAGEHK